MFTALIEPQQEMMHLPDGRTLHVVADSAAEGGVTYLYENVTERLSLESRYNALIHVQCETLDTLREGVAVFAPNGRLRLHNRAFAAMWRLSPAPCARGSTLRTWCRYVQGSPRRGERGLCSR